MVPQFVLVMKLNGRLESLPETLAISADPGCRVAGKPSASSAGKGRVASRPPLATSASSSRAAWSFEHARKCVLYKFLITQQHGAPDLCGCHAWGCATM